ncbi:MAG: acetylglutamate kinase [Acidobacteriota bacterium]
MKDVNMLREALPYIKKFKGQTFVIKFGGEVADNSDTLTSFCEEIALCAQVGIKVVTVHGGGKQATELSEKLGIEPKIINGRRITDEKTLDVVKMVFAGKINIEILGALRRAGVQPVGLSGVDGNILYAKRRLPQTVVDAKTGQQQTIDYGFVGDILDVNPKLITTLIENNFVPVIASLAADSNGDVYNVNADTVASSIAAELKVEKWIVATDVDGVLDLQEQLISRLTSVQAKTLISDKVITGGMIPKVEAALAAIEAGVQSVHIINGMKRGSLLAEVFTEGGAGTMLHT